MRICLPARTIPIDNGGIIVNASTVKMKSTPKNLERDVDTYICYGGNAQLIIQRNGNVVKITKTPLIQGEYPRKLHNLTSLDPSGNSLPIPSNITYWYIPFDLGTAQRVITEPPTCNTDPDDPCTTECILETVNGCLECKCLVEGDCDMAIAYRSGGVIIQADSVQIIDGQ